MGPIKFNLYLLYILNCFNDPKFNIYQNAKGDSITFGPIQHKETF